MCSAIGTGQAKCYIWEQNSVSQISQCIYILYIAVVDLWRNLVNKCPFHIQNHWTSQPALTNGNRPKSSVKIKVSLKVVVRIGIELG